MTEGSHGLSRRKLLGAVGTVGAAAALGGVGTTAFFSDEEEFANNRLVAGSLDLKLDWEEYYADWSDDEVAAVGDVLMAADSDQYLETYPDDYVGLPTPENALVAIPEGDVGAFFDAAATEAYPDTDDDGRVDYPGGYDVCVHGADTPADLDPTADPNSLDPSVDDAFLREGTGLRTNGDDTVAGGTPKPLISVEDLKPGDFGEVTLSTHLCDNDGYLWLSATQRSESDNSQTEPERTDPNENDGLAGGELADQIRVAVWYDGVETDDRGIDPTPGPSDPDGNNLLDANEMIIQEMSLSAFLAVADTGRGIGLLPPVVGGADGQDGPGGQLAFACAPEMGTVSQPGSAGIQPGQRITVGGADGDTTVTIDDVRTDDGDTVGFDFSVTSPQAIAPGNFLGVCSLKIEGSDGSVVVDYGAGGCVRNSLFLPRFDQPDVGTVESVTFDLCLFQGGGQVGGRPSFTGSNTYYIGFAWWLPVDHGNELQTDSVSFDLGFHAEQRRHNENPFEGIDLLGGLPAR